MIIKYIFRFVMCILIVIMLTVLLSCPSSKKTKTSDSDYPFIIIETLSDGEILTINSPVPVSVEIVNDPLTYPEGSKVTVVSLEGALDNNQTAKVSFTVDNSFEAADRIAYVEGEEWNPVFSTRSGDHMSISAEIDHFSLWGVIYSFSYPEIPVVTGPTPTNDSTPTWVWTVPKDADEIRYQLDSETGTWTVVSIDVTEFTPTSPLSEREHTLYVQARDTGGDWSSSGYFIITVDLTAPDIPLVDGEIQTNNTTPTWTWNIPLDAVEIRYQLDGETGTWTVVGTDVNEYTPEDDLDEGVHVLYVQAGDTLGNWSGSGSFPTIIDTTSPTVLTVVPADGAIDVSVTTLVSIEFSERMNVSATESAFTLNDGANDIIGSFSWDGQTMIFHPNSNLEYIKEYSINLDVTAIDIAGNSLEVWDPSHFTTAEDPSSSYLLIDHTAVQDFDQIPDYWLEQAKELTIHYGHRSHGMQIISGLKYIEENEDEVKYNVEYVLWKNDPTIPPQEDPSAHRICNTDWQPDDYWATEEGRNETRRFAASGLYDFSMFGWCGELSTSADLTDYINEYLSTLDLFEEEYPNMRFIYQTGFTDGYPDWSRLREHNDQIREYCINNNKVLYDFADIESWDPDGNYYPDDYSGSWCEDWCNNHSDECEDLPQECDSGLDNCCPHTHGYNCYIKGKAYWYMMARLAGWDGVP